MTNTSANTALTHPRIRSSVTGDAFGREDDSCDKLLCAGSLMQERYPILIKSNDEEGEGMKSVLSFRKYGKMNIFLSYRLLQNLRIFFVILMST